MRIICTMTMKSIMSCWKIVRGDNTVQLGEILDTKPEYLALISRTYNVKRENWLMNVVPWLAQASLGMCLLDCTSPFTPNNTNKMLGNLGFVFLEMLPHWHFSNFLWSLSMPYLGMVILLSTYTALWYINLLSKFLQVFNAPYPECVSEHNSVVIIKTQY